LLGNTTLSGSIIISGSENPSTPSVQIYGDTQHTGVVRFNPISRNIDPSISASYIYVSGSTNDLYFSQNGSGYANTTRLRWLEGNLYTGLLHGGLITTQSSTVYQISSGSGIIVDLNASLGDDPYPVIQFLEWGNLSASIAPLTASYQQAFVGIDSTNNIFAQGTPFSNGQFDTVINIGSVFFQNQSTINGVKTQPSVAYGFEQQQNVFNRAFGPLKLSGYTLSPSGSSTGSLIVGSGTAYAPGSNYTVDPNEPYYSVDNGTNISKIFRYYQSGSSWVYLSNAGAGYTTIDPTKYSNNGTLTSVGAGNWSIQRVFWFPNSVTKAIVVYYGNAIYPTEAEALANISFESFVEAPNTAANAIYLGAIIINQNGVFTNASTFTIYPGGLFRQVGGSGGGGSIVTQTLAGLSDVSISGPTNGQALVYNNTSAKWENSSTLTANLIGNASTATTASYALTASYTPSIAGTDNYIPRFNGSSALENSVMYDDGTNIGIGTTSPSYKIDVAGSGRLTLAGYAGYEYHNTAGTWEVYIGTENNTGNARYNSRQGDHTWYYNSSATMKLTSAGYLGVGTTTPTSNLQVQSNNLSAPAFAVSKSFSGGGDGTAVMHAFGYDSGIANTGIQVGVKGTGGFSATDAYPFRVFNQGTATFSMLSNGNAHFSGSVGIGTTSPSYKLDVVGEGRFGTGAKAIIGTDGTYAGYGVVGFGGTTDGYNRIFGHQSTSDGLYIAAATGRGIEFWVNGATTVAMRINPAGNVGIGTTSPTSKLHVWNDKIEVTGFPAAGSPFTFLESNYNDQSAVAIKFLNYNPSNGYDSDLGIQLMNTGGSMFDAMIIKGSTGNVGIGTNSPSYKLDVSGSIHAQESSTVGTLILGNTVDNYISYYNSDVYFKAKGSHYFEGNGFYKGVWNSNGNLGIGTSSPPGNSTNRAVEIAGADSANLVVTQPGYASAAFTSFNSEAYIGTSTNHPFYLYTSGSERLRIANNGAIRFNAYGSGTFTGTATQKLAVDSSGNVIEIPIGAGPVDGSGTANYITRWVDTDTITTSSIYETGGNIGIGTTSPLGKSTIIGDGSLNNYSGIVRIGTTAPTNAWAFITLPDDASVQTNANNYYLIGRTADVSNRIMSFHIPVAADYGSGSEPKFGFYSSGADLLHSIEANTGTSYFKGNVGIGTTTPAYKLSVVGKMALNDGGNSVFIGTNAGQSDDATDNRNIAIGTNSLQNNISGSQNVAIGYNTLVNNTNINNTAVGSNALQNNTTALNNTAFGSFALNANTVGSSSIAVGAAALLSNTIGNHNTAVGNSAIRLNVSGSQNVGVGGSVLFNNTNGSDNVALGWNAARYFGTGTSSLTDTSGSIFIGSLARANASGEVNQVVIGMNALGLGSNSVVLGNDNITKTVLKGSVGIGTNVPMGPLEIYKANAAGLGGHLILNNDGSSVGNETAILFNDSGGGSLSGVRAAISSTTENSPYNGDIKFKTGNTSYGSLSTRMIITGAGNVGIGTTSPGVKLEVYDSANANAVTITSDGANQQLVIRRYSSTNEQLIFGVHSSDYSYIQAVEQGVAYRALSLNPDGGNVGIGTTNPAYLLDVNGTARVTTLIETSALKYKTNIQPLDSQLSKVAQLEPVTFDWIDKPNPKTNIGLIADEVEKIYPEFVSKTEDGEIEGIEYSKLTTVLIQSIKELKEIVDKQQEQINALLNK
jgi:hypothetical protein